MISDMLLLESFSGADAKMEKQCFDCDRAGGLRVGLSIKSLEIVEKRQHRVRSSRTPFFVNN